MDEFVHLTSSHLRVSPGEGEGDRETSAVFSYGLVIVKTETSERCKLFTVCTP